MKKAKAQTKLKTATFRSPSFGKLPAAGVLGKIADYMAADSEAKYRLVIGTDSQPRGSRQEAIDYVTAIIVHRVGSGGIYFWTRTIGTKFYSLRERIYTEALLSLQLAQDFLRDFESLGIFKYDLEIHVDVGNVGETRAMITEVVGMIRANGFNVKTKPEAYGASTVADRHA